MPEAEELEHHGHPDFRVKNKIFATLWPDENRVVLKIPFDDQVGRLESSRRALSVIKWGKQRWTNVQLQYIDAKIFRDLVDDAWREVASKTLVAKYVSD